jgi:MscS family membrane protein
MPITVPAQLEAVQQGGAASVTWVRDHLPSAMQGMGPFGIAWWQWLALSLLIPAGATLGYLLVRPVQAGLRRLVAATPTQIDDLLVEASRGPIILLVGVLASRILVGWVALAQGPLGHVVDLQQALLVVAVFWTLLRLVGVVERTAPGSAWVHQYPAMRSLIPLGARITRVLLVVLAALSVLTVFGYPVVTILAGLGIGGIALALAAQKTLENLFGSLSIGVDQPFRVGDPVNIEGVEGEVEAIGLRSTRIRTAERTVVSLPNGRLAEMRAENVGERDRFRFRTVVPLDLATAPDAIERIRDGIESLLRAHPQTWSEGVQVRLIGMTTASLDLEVVCWVQTRLGLEFKRVREQHLLGILRLLRASGVHFAAPPSTTTVSPIGP